MGAVRAAAGALLLGLIGWALFGVDYVATNDGPNHFANCVLAARLADPDSALHAYLELGTPLTGQGFHSICRPLAAVFPPFLAYRLTLLLIVALSALGAGWVAWTLDRDGPAWPFAFAMSMPWIFYMGFFSFQVAVLISFFVTQQALKIDPARLKSYAPIALGLLFAAYCHVFQAALCGVVVVAILVARAPSGAAPRVLLGALVAAAPAGMLVLSMSATFALSSTFAAVGKSVDLNPPHERAPVKDLIETFAGGPSEHAIPLLVLALACVFLGLIRWRVASRAQRVLLGAAGLAVALSLVVPFHLDRWSYFAPRLVLFPLVLAPMATPWPERLAIRRGAELLFVGVAIASLTFSLRYHQHLYEQLAPDLEGLALPAERTGPRLPVVMTSVPSEMAHATPSSMLGHLYVIQQGGLNPFVWADEWSVDALLFARPPAELFGGVPPRYARAFLDDPPAGAAPRSVRRDFLIEFGRRYEDVILISDTEELSTAFAQRGFRVDGAAGRTQLLRFQGCSLTVELSGPQTLVHGLILQVGLPDLERPLEQRLLEPGTEIPSSGRAVEISGLLCGPLWWLVRAGVEAPTEGQLHCEEHGDQILSSVALAAGTPTRAPCHLVPTARP